MEPAPVIALRDGEGLGRNLLELLISKSPDYCTLLWIVLNICCVDNYLLLTLHTSTLHTRPVTDHPSENASI